LTPSAAGEAAHTRSRDRLIGDAVAVSNRIAIPTERILIMNVPARANIDEATRTALAELALGDPELLGEGLEMRAEMQRRSGLDSRSFALVKIAALIALDAPPASYLWQVGNALDAGATPEDLIGVLRAIAPQVGGPKTVAAAPELMVALGLALPEGV
jgi:4-carboxymuconolactone decarboxylase